MKVRQPIIIQKKVTGGQVADIGLSTAMGFATGGPPGAALAFGGKMLSTILDNKKAKEAQAEQDRINMRNKVLESGKNFIQNRAKGGKIKGKGTAKSDSVKTKMNPGDFVVPAENASKAMEWGRNYLNWGKDKTAPHQDGSEPVAASNGEVKFTKDEYDYLKEIGLNVDSLAPNAKDNETSETDSPAKEKGEGEAPTDNEGKEQDAPAKEKSEGELGTGTEEISDANEPPSKEIKEKEQPKKKIQHRALGGGISEALSSFFGKGGGASDAMSFLGDNSGEIMGAAQTIGGILKGKKANQTYDKIKPIKDTSGVYNTQANIVERKANDAAKATFAEGDAAGSDAMTNFMKLAREHGGSNAGTILANAASVSDKAGKTKLDAVTKANNIKLAGAEKGASLRTTGAESSTRIQKMNNDQLNLQAEKESKAANDLVSAGINNFVGAQMFKKFKNRQDAQDAYYKSSITHTDPMSASLNPNQDWMTNYIKNKNPNYSTGTTSKKNGGRIKKSKKKA